MHYVDETVQLETFILELWYQDVAEIFVGKIIGLRLL